MANYDFSASRLAFQLGGGRGDLGGDFRGEFGFGACEVKGDLQAQPNGGRAAEVPGETQRRFRRDCALTAHDLADSRGR